ncbi:MAG: tyrosine--tRNA ligase [Parcubacteria group bacterium CG11_big_fil_rev_8_21_14_0_20_39_14]|nr:MAG: tyrosine--tRNA ligase [Parcubacteria group bacterium CG11_big_fil_rev_8_21_14_0_20_39_14]PIS35402.1 MAG: tyrosine--tRNA ligase [Parcubacteria group bacterium CG08_land_8_20_14_0_20_38_56]
MEDKKIKEILEKGVEEIIEKDSLEKKLKSGKKLTIKFGADPTAPDLHLGHSICLKKIKEFQDLGHKVVFIIGDFTAKIGDPSGRTKARPPLSEKEIKENTKTYLTQVGKILDTKKIGIKRNSEWLSKMSFADIFKISHFFTVNQLLEGNIFRKRWEEHKPIWIQEFFYPILQAYDSVIIKSDVEIGGTDQLFNMLMGRLLQSYFKQAPQDIITLKLLIGTEGKQKMSKSFGNYIGIAEKPKEQYGKIMSIPDSLILHYFELCAKFSPAQLRQVKKDFESSQINPRDLKAKLAKEIVAIYHGTDEAREAEKEFNRVFKEREIPKELKTCELQFKSLNILDLLVKTNLTSSKAKARRLVEQGAVKLILDISRQSPATAPPRRDPANHAYGGFRQRRKCGKKLKRTIKNWREKIEIKKGTIIQAGKRKFVKLV